MRILWEIQDPYFHPPIDRICMRDAILLSHRLTRNGPSVQKSSLISMQDLVSSGVSHILHILIELEGHFNDIERSLLYSWMQFFVPLHSRRKTSDKCTLR